MKEKFRFILLRRIQKTFLTFLKPSFLSWLAGTIMIANEILPCNNAIEYGIFSAALICSPAIVKRFKK